MKSTYAIIFKTAMDELDLSRTKLLVSIRRLIEKKDLVKLDHLKMSKIYIYLNDDDISKFNALFEDVVKSRLLCKMLYNVFTISLSKLMYFLKNKSIHHVGP